MKNALNLNIACTGQTLRLAAHAFTYARSTNALFLVKMTCAQIKFLNIRNTNINNNNNNDDDNNDYDVDDDDNNIHLNVKFS